MKLYGEISKTEEMNDGTIKVWGYASSESVDSDGEVITSDAMKGALVDYMKFGAVREMHQPKAAGTAIEMNVEDDGRTYFGAHIVDSEAVKKVKASVYKGFSIGGKVTERDELNKTIIKGIKLVEVSLVDRPANPDAVFTCYKAETIEETPAAAIDQIAELLNKGEITPEKLLELAKGSSLPVEKQEVVEKGMSHVAQLAYTLKGILWLVQDQLAEAAREGDGSKVPDALKAWLVQGGEILKDMVTEEVSELNGQADPDDDGDSPMIALAERAISLTKAGKADLSKAGAKFSKDTLELIQEAHDSVKKADDALEKLGYKGSIGDDQESQRAENATDNVGVKADHTADLAKVAGELDIAKADLAKASSERDAFEKRVKELEAMPAPGKALLKAVGKDQDIGETVVEGDKIDKVEPVKDATGTVNEAATLIKSIHRGVGAFRV